MPVSPIVWFHVGGHKTGTTFVQSVLWHNRAELRRDGFLVPGEAPNAHVWANLDLREASFKGYRAPQVDGAWPRLVQEIRDWNGPAVIDHELFSLGRPHHVQRALSDLSFAEVHIVFTARDMARQLPAVWQEWVKNGDTISYGEFLTAVRNDTDQARRLRSLHDLPAILAKWSANLPVDRVHVVTVPPPGADRGVLWQRFAGLLGLEPERYATDGLGTNSSLGAAEAAVVRRLNASLRGVAQPRYDRFVKSHLAPQLAARRGARIELPEDAYDWAVAQAEAAVAALRDVGYDVVGDLAELIPSARPTGADPDRVASDELADAAIAGLAAMVRQPVGGRSQAAMRQLRGRLAEAERQLRDHESNGGPGTRHRQIARLRQIAGRATRHVPIGVRNRLRRNAGH